MSIVYTEITLKNCDDIAIAGSGLKQNHDIREITVQALVDTGSWTLVINEDTRNKLGLRVSKRKTGKLADGSVTEYSMAGPVKIIWKNRDMVCDAIVLPKANDILLGAIPLEAMDLMVHLKNEEVIGVHGDLELHKVYQFGKQKMPNYSSANFSSTNFSSTSFSSTSFSSKDPCKNRLSS